MDTEAKGREIEAVDGKAGGVHGIKGIIRQAKDFKPIWCAMESNGRILNGRVA